MGSWSDGVSRKIKLRQYEETVLYWGTEPWTLQVTNVAGIHTLKVYGDAAAIGGERTLRIDGSAIVRGYKITAETHEDPAEILVTPGPA